ncbi:MAG: glycosyltransferase family 4 protein [bacterium]|nr:glycosyltransferase family 4 protein [bacterium]
MAAMRVLVDARMCTGGRDGVTTYVLRLLREFGRTSEVQPVALCADAVPGDISALEVETLVTDFDRSKRVYDRRWRWERRCLPSILRSAGIDLYHATWNTGVPAVCPIPAVLTIHDLIPQAYPADYFATRRQRWAHWLAQRGSIRGAARILTVSDHTRAECVRRLRVPQDRIEVIPNGVDQPGHIAANARLANEDYVLYVGGAEKRKNVAGVLAAMDHLWSRSTDAPELWLTGLLERQCPSARAVYATIRHPERVRFLGHPGDQRLGVLLSSARALLMLSTAEGFGLPVLEAMAGACPVIASRRTALPEVVGDAGILVDPDDIDAVARAVSAVARDGALRADLIERGHRRSAEFTWAKAARATSGAYRAAITAWTTTRRAQNRKLLRRFHGASRLAHRPGPNGLAEAI